MEVQQDFKELLELFNKHHVEYMIVGGYALAFHGVPRYTGDMDIYIKPDSQNGERITTALKDFGFENLSLSIEDFIYPEKVIQLGVPPVRIDIITSLSGVTWDEAFTGRMIATYGDSKVFIIGREQFIVNKKATGRKRDIADLESLGIE